MNKENESSISKLDEQDRTNLGDMILGETLYKVNYLEEDYRVLQVNPIYLDEDEVTELNNIRNKLGDQLSKWLKREESFSEMTHHNHQELNKLLHKNEIDCICEHNIELYYQLKDLTEVIVRYDVELLSDRINKQAYFHQNLVEMEQLIGFVQKHQLSFLEKEITVIKNYIHNKYRRT